MSAVSGKIPIKFIVPLVVSGLLFAFVLVATRDRNQRDPVPVPNIDTPAQAPRRIEPPRTNVAPVSREEPAPEEAPESFVFQIRFDPGKVYHYVFINDLEMNIRVPDMTPIESTVHQELELRMVCIQEFAGGSFELEVRVESMLFESDAGGTQFTFDTERQQSSEKGPEIGEALRKIVENRYLIRVSKAREVLSVRSAIALSFRNPNLAALQEGLAPETLEALFGEGLRTRADGAPLRAGSTWTESLTVPMDGGGKMYSNSECEVDRWTDRDGARVAEISIDSKLTLGALPGGIPRGMKMTMERAKATGRMWFDPALGQIVESITESSFQIVTRFLGQTTTILTRNTTRCELDAVVDDTGK